MADSGPFPSPKHIYTPISSSSHPGLPTTPLAPIPLWLDCDTGHDDAFALLLCAHHPSLHLLGVSTVHGNAPLSHTTINTLRILRAIGRSDVPVYTGAANPSHKEAEFAPEIHGKSGLDGVPLLPHSEDEEPHEGDAIDAAYKALISQPPGKAWVVATGPLTNIATLLQRHPILISHLAGLSFMGGVLGHGFTSAPIGRPWEPSSIGNWTFYAEFNIWCDPQAAFFLLSHPQIARKTTLIPLDVTHQVIAREREVGHLLWGWMDPNVRGLIDAGVYGKFVEIVPSRIRAIFYQIITFFSKTYEELFGFVTGPPLHDPLAVAAILTPDSHPALTWDDRGGERFKVEVVTEGEQVGRTIPTLLPSGEEGVRIPRGLNTKAFWDLLDASLANAEAGTVLKEQLSKEGETPAIGVISKRNENLTISWRKC
ncbi:uridine nucleosidase Urh1 [Patellaria atrata CBS 101060]|uniref:Uridine nucleosidase Urh1 n=1 Tax=Patellaria atrata CBS 101060 TaxID=1346257 RepID=A0A9P4S1X0_9PEZI|nr:uridine nucleosidase Urh1 [Patellaria atrata CBS 101060]